MKEEMISKVDRESFWQLIAEAKQRFPENMDAYEEWVKTQLKRMGTEETFNFFVIFYGYMDAACEYGLWTAASMIKEYGCGDDGFTDFRSWLIAQGKEVYLNALKNPDSLADVPVYGDSCFERFGYVADYAYEELTGKSVYSMYTPQAQKSSYTEALREIEYGELVKYPFEFCDAKIVFPKLSRKYLTAEKLYQDKSGKMWNWRQPNLRRLLEEGQSIARRIQKLGRTNHRIQTGEAR